jgi:polysaccharide export outer membrane protein
MQDPGKEIPTYKEVIEYQEYKLKPGDVVNIKIYSVNEETNKIFNSGNTQSSAFSNAGNGVGTNTNLQNYTIGADGKIRFPMIGEVLIAGFSVRDAKKIMEESLKPLYHFNNIELRITGRYFSIIDGSVSGNYPMVKEKVNIFQALAMGGDVSTSGDRSKVKIVRETQNGTIIREFDLRSKDIINSEFYYVEPYDIIYIQTRDDEFFNMTNLPSLFSSIVSTFSFTLFIYQLFFVKTAN